MLGRYCMICWTTPGLRAALYILYILRISAHNFINMWLYAYICVNIGQRQRLRLLDKWQTRPLEKEGDLRRQRPPLSTIWQKSGHDSRKGLDTKTKDWLAVIPNMTLTFTVVTELPGSRLSRYICVNKSETSAQPESLPEGTWRGEKTVHYTPLCTTPVLVLPVMYWCPLLPEGMWRGEELWTTRHCARHLCLYCLWCTEVLCCRKVREEVKNCALHAAVDDTCACVACDVLMSSAAGRYLKRWKTVHYTPLWTTPVLVLPVMYWCPLLPEGTWRGEELCTIRHCARHKCLYCLWCTDVLCCRKVPEEVKNCALHFTVHDTCACIACDVLMSSAAGRYLKRWRTVRYTSLCTTPVFVLPVMYWYPLLPEGTWRGEELCATRHCARHLCLYCLWCTDVLCCRSHTVLYCHQSSSNSMPLWWYPSPEVLKMWGPPPRVKVVGPLEGGGASC
jgi:hypothetical protein